MNARSAWIAAICIFAAIGRAAAQQVDEPAPAGSVTELPAVTVYAPPKRVSARPARRVVTTHLAKPPVRIRVFATPLAGKGVDVDKVPASVTTVSAGEIARTQSLNVTDTLQAAGAGDRCQ